MAEHGRSRKLADRIKVVVAQALEHRVKDPRLGFITVTDTRVTRDLQHATIFYTVLGTDEEKTSTAAALESAKGILRSEVGRQTGVRLTPTIEFVLDGIPENAATISDLLVAAKAHDAEVARIAEGAQYAGEADPYRRDEEDEGDEDDEADSSEFDDETDGEADSGEATDRADRDDEADAVEAPRKK